MVKVTREIFTIQTTQIWCATTPWINIRQLSHTPSSNEKVPRIRGYPGQSWYFLDNSIPYFKPQVLQSIHTLLYSPKFKTSLSLSCKSLGEMAFNQHRSILSTEIFALGPFKHRYLHLASFLSLSVLNRSRVKMNLRWCVRLENGVLDGEVASSLRSTKC